MNPLIVTPVHYEDESLWGFALRVSEENGYETPWHMLAYADIDQRSMKTAGFPYHKLAMLVGRPADVLEPIAYFSETNPGVREYKVLGHLLGKSVKYNPFRIKSPSFCPDCVAQNGYIHAFWDLTHAVACPLHGSLPIRQCQQCGGKLTWFRRGLTTCKCGATLEVSESPEIPQTILDLMSLLWAKLHMKPVTSLENSSNFPIEDLYQMPLRSLIALIPSLANLVRRNSKSTSPLTAYDDVAEVASIFENWPSNYHAFLRNYASMSLEVSPNAIGLRKRFESLYQSLFKAPIFAKDIAFMKHELVNFGLQEWGEVVVDNKMIGSESKQKRYLSITEFAQQVGLRPVTIKRWAEKGNLEIKRVSVNNHNRYVVDSYCLPVPKISNSPMMQEREAAAYIGLPVRVLVALKASETYSVEYMHKYKQGYAEEDLINFKEKLLAKSVCVEKALITDGSAFSLNYIMQKIKFGSQQGKSDFIKSYLKGKILSIGKISESLDDIFFRKNDVVEFALECRNQLSAKNGVMTFQEASSLIGADHGALMGLVNAGHIIQMKGQRNASLVRKSVENFSSNYLSLASISEDKKTSSTRLFKLCNENSIPLLSVSREPKGTAPFINRGDYSDLIKLLQLNPTRSERVARNKLLMNDSPSKLAKYLEELRVKGESLPYRSGKLNKRKIAAKCGFSRNTLYQNEIILQMLNNFEKVVSGLI